MHLRLLFLGLMLHLPLAMPSLVAQRVDMDGDGLLDLIDVDGLDPNAIGRLEFSGLGVQDLDGASQLTMATVFLF